MHRLKEVRDVTSDQQNHGLQATVIIDRATAARLGVTLAAIDSALYDAFGQRQVSAMYSGMNQYHVVMEVDSAVLRARRTSLSSVYVHSRAAATFRSVAFATFGIDQTPLSINAPGAVPRRHGLVQPRAGRLARRGDRPPSRISTREMSMPSSIHPRLPGNRAGIPGVARRTSRC